MVLTFVFLRFAYLPRRLCKVLLLDIFPMGKKKISGERKILLVEMDESDCTDRLE